MKDNKYLYREFLRKKIYHFRISHSYTQEKMAELIHVEPRSYLEQEHGKYGFSAYTLLFYLSVLPENEILKFLEEFRQFQERVEEE